MIRSMTGFARATSSSPKGRWAVEIRSLNHRYFEFSLKVPPLLNGFEDRIRELCQNRIRRGKITLNISELESSSLEDVALDEKVLKFYVSAIRKVQRRLGLKGELSVSDLLSLPRIFSVEKKAKVPEALWASLKPLIEKTLGQLTHSRIREGRVLFKDLTSRIRKIQDQLSHIETRTKGLSEEYYEKLKRRIQNLVNGIAAGNDRIWQEAAILAEKADVTEEIVRLTSHLRLFGEKMAANGEMGKELDFLLQEMNREINTLSAKSQDFRISKEVVSIKAELEKIREQIQNIE